MGIFDSITSGFRSLSLSPRVRHRPDIITMPDAMLTELWESNEPDDAPGLRAMVQEAGYAALTKDPEYIAHQRQKRTLAEIEANADELAQRFMDFDPNPEIVDASDVFAVAWDEETGDWVATCSRFPSLSWCAAAPLGALDGLLRVMAS